MLTLNASQGDQSTPALQGVQQQPVHSVCADRARGPLRPPALGLLGDWKGLDGHSCNAVLLSCLDAYGKAWRLSQRYCSWRQRNVCR